MNNGRYSVRVIGAVVGLLLATALLLPGVAYAEPIECNVVGNSLTIKVNRSELSTDVIENASLGIWIADQWPYPGPGVDAVEAVNDIVQLDPVHEVSASYSLQNGGLSSWTFPIYGVGMVSCWIAYGDEYMAQGAMWIVDPAPASVALESISTSVGPIPVSLDATVPVSVAGTLPVSIDGSLPVSVNASFSTDTTMPVDLASISGSGMIGAVPVAGILSGLGVMVAIGKIAMRGAKHDL